MGNLYDDYGNRVGYIGNGGPGCLKSIGILVMVSAALGICCLIYYWTKSLTLLFIAVAAVIFLAYGISKNDNANKKFLSIAKIVAIVALVLGGLYIIYLLIGVDMK